MGQVLVGSDGLAKGVALKDGTEIQSKVVLSNATPYVTFKNLTPQVLKKDQTPQDKTVIDDLIFLLSPQSALPPGFIKAVDQIDYTSPVTKINGKTLIFLSY